MDTATDISAEWDGAVEVVNGYRILKHLGRGAYAEVRLCRSPSGAPGAGEFCVRCCQGGAVPSPRQALMPTVACRAVVIVTGLEGAQQATAVKAA